MRFLEVLIERDERMSVPAVVAPWEVPVLEAVHTPEKVKVIGIANVNAKAAVRGYPDPQKEFERLELKFKMDIEGDGKSYASNVYGSGFLGVQALGRAIQEVQAQELSELDPI